MTRFVVSPDVAVRLARDGTAPADGHHLLAPTLGDRVLQRVAWTIAAELDRADTVDAEYLALTRLQADAFVTRDAAAADAARGVVPVAPYEALTEPV